jgi:hypothetical protein
LNAVPLKITWLTGRSKLLRSDSYHALGPYEALKDANPAWGKQDNWRIARLMSKKDLAGEAFGVSAAFLVNVLDPEMVVVGGGLGTAEGLYWDAFIRSCREHIFAANSRGLPIVRAKLGIDAGVVGAAAIVFANQHKNKASDAYETK